ncbi:hypothetical protein M9Y10_001890 [Tritrichomonas musculus]|uniref:Caspase family p20 domain-containing protein n=1 Tax=Tritrichomonas musculus TaxID=1915356 RepID=A0ABR2L882_9EUKA
MEDNQAACYEAPIIQPGIDAPADNNTCYDKPDKKQKHPHYEHRTTKLMRKNNEFSEKKFQNVRKISSQKKILKSFERIGRCLNHVSRNEMPKEGYDKVCLILMNNYEHDKHDPQVGVMNDGYLFGLYHHRLGFKVFYLYNCVQGNYPKYLQFFLIHTRENLTVFYSGRDSINMGCHGIEFKDKTVTSNQFGRLIARDNNGLCKVVFVSDCIAGGSVFDISMVNKVEKPNPSGMVSFSVDKLADPNSKDGRRSHGIFTYYFCKFIYECPNITPQRLVERMNASLKRFNMTFSCESTSQSVADEPMYKPSEHSSGKVPFDEFINDGDSNDSNQEE